MFSPFRASDLLIWEIENLKKQVAREGLVQIPKVIEPKKQNTCGPRTLRIGSHITKR